MRVLTVNTGSSSLRAGLYALDQQERALWSAHAERIASPVGRLRVLGPGGQVVADERLDRPDHPAALRAVLEGLRSRDLRPDAVGHRVVHGGTAFREPSLITPEIVSTLQQLVPLAPDHLPQALQGMLAVGDAFPVVPQVACFDTSFHRRMPRRAQRYALPGSIEEMGVMRYGFHGLSYESIVWKLRTETPSEAEGRLIVAHLGNGASLAAVRGGASVDTTMGFTPAGGIVMGTRSGDLDPGVPIYLQRVRGMSAETLDTLVNRQAGLLGVSGTTGDMRELLEREGTDTRAAEAIELFSYHARKSIGSLTAALGGIDSLVFTGGIGEHAASVRARICDGLQFLGIALDARRNEANAAVISPDAGTVTVRVMKTDEDLMIARHTCRALGRREGGR